ncbi:MAG: hypothetical protein HYT87_07220 [Nitrospirae bacterium]|nr:hypothetical protein [Nitrospirota bacterium]
MPEKDFTPPDGEPRNDDIEPRFTEDARRRKENRDREDVVNSLARCRAEWTPESYIKANWNNQPCILPTTARTLYGEMHSARRDRIPNPLRGVFPSLERDLRNTFPPEGRTIGDAFLAFVRNHAGKMSGPVLLQRFRELVGEVMDAENGSEKISRFKLLFESKFQLPKRKPDTPKDFHVAVATAYWTLKQHISPLFPPMPKGVYKSQRKDPRWETALLASFPNTDLAPTMTDEIKDWLDPTPKGQGKKGRTPKRSMSGLILHLLAPMFTNQRGISTKGSAARALQRSVQVNRFQTGASKFFPPPD